MRITSTALITNIETVEETNHRDTLYFRTADFYYMIPKQLTVDVDFEGLNSAAILRGTLTFDLESPEFRTLYKLQSLGYPIKITMEVGG